MRQTFDAPVGQVAGGDIYNYHFGGSGGGGDGESPDLEGQLAKYRQAYYQSLRRACLNWPLFWMAVAMGLVLVYSVALSATFPIPGLLPPLLAFVALGWPGYRLSKIWQREGLVMRECRARIQELELMIEMRDRLR